jgi:hypothetical protein
MSCVNLKLHPYEELKLLYQHHLEEALKLIAPEKLSAVHWHVCSTN